MGDRIIEPDGPQVGAFPRQDIGLAELSAPATSWGLLLSKLVRGYVSMPDMTALGATEAAWVSAAVALPHETCRCVSAMERHLGQVMPQSQWPQETGRFPTVIVRYPSRGAELKTTIALPPHRSCQPVRPRP